MKRIAVFLVTILFCFFCGWVLIDWARGPEKPERYSTHLVQPGDTLWNISQQYMPEVDPRLGVEWISQVNGLHGTTIHPGDVLNVPDYDGPFTEPQGP